VRKPLVGENLNPDISEARLADVVGHGRVSLEREGASRQPEHPRGQLMLGIRVGDLVLDLGFPIELHGQLAVLADNLLREPDVILHRGLRQNPDHLLIIGGRRFRTPGDVFDGIHTARPTPVHVAIVYLAFKAAFRPASFLIFRMEVDPRVRTRERHYLNPKVKVFKGVVAHIPVIKQVSRAADRLRTLHHDHAVQDLEHAGVFADLPAGEGLSVEQADKAFLGGRRFGSPEGSTQTPANATTEKRFKLSASRIRNLAEGFVPVVGIDWVVRRVSIVFI
jgi:hypothetical protein